MDADRGMSDESRPELFVGGRPRSWREASRRVDSYGFLLVVLVLLIWVVIPASGTNEGLGVASAVVTLWTVLIAMRSSGSGARRQTLVVGTAATGVALVIAGIVADHGEIEASGRVLLATPFLVAAVIVLRHVVKHRVVTSRTIAGAVCVFLIVSVAFAHLFTAVDRVQGHAFAPGTSSLGLAELQYFSLVTIATVGYGDIVPVTRPAQSLATLESVAGQIYLVVIVARLVTTFGQLRPGEREAEPPPIG